MKNLTMLAALCLLCLVTNAQYKKASFIARGGVSMEVTARASFITQSHCVAPALAFSVGREKDGSRYFMWHDFEFLLPAKYSYTTTTTDGYSEKDEQVNVHAKALYGFTYRFNSGIFLLDNSNEENKILPFVNFGANFTGHMGSDENSYVYEPANYNGYLTEAPSAAAAYVGLNAGIGVIYKITRVIGVKATAGYSAQLNLTNIDMDDYGSTEYGFYKSHPYATVGVRFVIPRKGD